jgi:exopolysaccharide biosynthesis polyprenyl glycosylphosphotransferase
MITTSPYKSVQRKTLILAAESTALGIVILTVLRFGVLRFGVLPKIGPAHDAMTSVVLTWIFALLCASSMTLAVMRRRKRDQGLLIVGADDLARDLCRRLAEMGMIAQGQSTIACEHLNALSIEKGTTRIIVAESNPADCAGLATSLIDCKLRGVAVEEAASFHERLTGKLWVKHLRRDWWMYSDGFQPSRVYLWRKRLMDIVCASLMIAVTAPLLLLIAVGIKLDTPGPAIFKQERVGLHGASFTLYKFRSMKMDAESKSGPAWAAEFDNRVTRFGQLLRKFRLDEIPQAWNVLRGDMSFAGPRPERPYFVHMLSERVPYYGLRHYVKPGITGWAQVNYPYGASVEDAIEKLQYDLYYIKHMSFHQDLLVVLKTCKVVFFGRERWTEHEQVELPA